MEKIRFDALEAQIKEMSNRLTNLANEKDFHEFFLIIRKPGWTTPAELFCYRGR